MGVTLLWAVVFCIMAIVTGMGGDSGIAMFFAILSCLLFAAWIALIFDA